MQLERIGERLNQLNIKNSAKTKASSKALILESILATFE
jgi:hypothetical protein